MTSCVYLIGFRVWFSSVPFRHLKHAAKTKSKGRDLRQRVGGQPDLSKLLRCFLLNQLWIILLHIYFFPLSTLRERSLVISEIFFPSTNIPLLITFNFLVGVGNKSWKLKFLFFSSIVLRLQGALYLQSSSSKPCDAGVWLPTCISPNELGCAVETNNATSQCLKAAKLVYCYGPYPL